MAGRHRLPALTDGLLLPLKQVGNGKDHPQDNGQDGIANQLQNKDNGTQDHGNDKHIQEDKCKHNDFC
ncbi:hypothetical protein PRBRB14_22090 [Hallella multisaccharivorax DSM 17128]|nr:hypothetical protein PRBRB14_22090 [Hallella multisaccharivorax DSM 17128]